MNLAQFVSVEKPQQMPQGFESHIGYLPDSTIPLKSMQAAAFLFWEYYRHAVRLVSSEAIFLLMQLHLPIFPWDSFPHAFSQAVAALELFRINFSLVSGVGDTLGWEGTRTSWYARHNGGGTLQPKNGPTLRGSCRPTKKRRI